MVATLSDLSHHKKFGFYFFLGNLSLEKYESFGQRQQKPRSKAARAFIKSSKSNDIERRESED